ncbi:hypothetical protein HQ529_04445 [Candidatus Woesearchaeota archaeon]|nr:hypothetical protein [Candidatus Woesearchaeota archaeon]
MKEELITRVEQLEGRYLAMKFLDHNYDFITLLKVQDGQIEEMEVHSDEDTFNYLRKENIKEVHTLKRDVDSLFGFDMNVNDEDCMYAYQGLSDPYYLRVFKEQGIALKLIQVQPKPKASDLSFCLKNVGMI